MRRRVLRHELARLLRGHAHVHEVDEVAFGRAHRECLLHEVHRPVGLLGRRLQVFRRFRAAACGCGRLLGEEAARLFGRHALVHVADDLLRRRARSQSLLDEIVGPILLLRFGA